MSDHELFQALLRFRVYALIELACEFQFPKSTITRTDFMAWCFRQGQREHLIARVQEIQMEWN
jgi:hypothetical protein